MKIFTSKEEKLENLYVSESEKTTASLSLYAFSKVFHAKSKSSAAYSQDLYDISRVH